MTLKDSCLPLFAMAALAVLAAGVDSAEACACGYASPAAHARSTDVVFVGSVESVSVPRSPSTTSRDGTGAVSGFSAGAALPATVTMRVQRLLKGELEGTVRLRGDAGDCQVTFAVGETWMVYARRDGDALTTSKCSRTRLLAQAGADLDYFDGLARGRQQGVVSGFVLRRAYDGDGKPISVTPPRNAGFVVVALAGGRRYTMGVDWSTYEMVLPVGEARLWIEQEGRRVSPETTMSVTDGGDHQLALVIGNEG